MLLDLLTDLVNLFYIVGLFFQSRLSLIIIIT